RRSNDATCSAHSRASGNPEPKNWVPAFAGTSGIAEAGGLMDLALNGRVALVTGAARDVGREIALTLAAEGTTVAVNYLSSAAEAEAVVAEIKQKGGKAKAYKADVSDYSAVKEMVEAVVKDFGALNVLVNNAGLARRQRFVETTPEDWKKQVDICLYGAIHCCHAAAPHLEGGKN